MFTRPNDAVASIMDRPPGRLADFVRMVHAKSMTNLATYNFPEDVVPFEACYYMFPHFFAQVPMPMTLADDRPFLAKFDYLTGARAGERRALVVRAAQGRGKTQAMAECIADLMAADRIQSVLFVVCRISHGAQLVHEFQRYNVHLQDYRDAHGEQRGLLVVQYDSLWKFFFHERADDVADRGLDFVLTENARDLSADELYTSFDCVVLDESQALEKHAFSTTLRHPYLCFEALKKAVANATYVLAMDADAGDTTLDLILTLRDPRQVHVVWDLVPQRPQRTYYMYTRQPYWLRSLLEDVASGKKVYVASDSKAQLTAMMAAVATIVGDVTTKTYTGDSADAEKKDLVYCEVEWPNYTVVGSTPVIVYGVSFARRHFDRLYMLFTRRSVTAREAWQMAGRVRQLEDREAHVFVQTNEAQMVYETDGGNRSYEVGDLLLHLDAVRKAVFKATTGVFAAHVAALQTDMQREQSITRFKHLFRSSLFFRTYVRHMDEMVHRELRFRRLFEQMARLAGHVTLSSFSLRDRAYRYDLATVKPFCSTKGDVDPLLRACVLHPLPDGEETDRMRWMERSGRTTPESRRDLRLVALYESLGLQEHTGLDTGDVRRLWHLDSALGTRHVDNFAAYLTGLRAVGSALLRERDTRYFVQQASMRFAPFAVVTGMLTHLGIYHPLLFRRAEYRQGRRHATALAADGMLRAAGDRTYFAIPATGDDPLPEAARRFFDGLFDDATVLAKVQLVFPDWASRRSKWERRRDADPATTWTYRLALDAVNRVTKVLFGMRVKTRGKEVLVPHVHWERRDAVLEILLARQENRGARVDGVDMRAVCKACGIVPVMSGFTGITAETIAAYDVAEQDLAHLDFYAANPFAGMGIGGLLTCDHAGANIWAAPDEGVRVDAWPDLADRPAEAL